MYTESALMVYCEDVCPLPNDCKSLISVMRDRMEDITVFSTHELNW
jgi:hypothetical protein